MKHIKRISHRAPATASSLQDIVCIIATALTSFIAALGGAEPIFQFVTDKCSFPDANS